MTSGLDSAAYAAIAQAAAVQATAQAALLSSPAGAATLAAAIAALPPAQLLALVQALLAALPTQTGGAAPVAPGQFFINNDGVAVVAQ